MNKDLYLDLELTPKQRSAFQTRANELLYGGAKGGGKSHLMRVCAIIWCLEVPGLQVYLFRRHLPDLIRNHIEGPSGFRTLLAGFINAGYAEMVEDQIRFKNGSKIYLCHCKDDADRWKYHGAEIHVLMMDELTTFSEVIYRFLRANVRAVGLQVPEKYQWKDEQGKVQSMFPRIICSSNPGSIGHAWVKRSFIDPVPEGFIWVTPASEGGMRRQFIRALLFDNPYMTAQDPTYEQRLDGLGSPSLVKAMKNGDWSVVQGAFFPEFRLSHQIQPFEIPGHWTKFYSMDWGSAKPFYVGWFAVASEPVYLQCEDGTTRYAPEGSLIQYREWNGELDYDVGMKLTPAEVADGIHERQAEQVHYGVADYSIFDEDGGPSIAEKFRLEKIYFNRADKKRLPGWTELRSRLVGVDGVPTLYFFKTCPAIIRDLPALQHSEVRPEDAESEGVADHSCDALRYACMSRPFATKQKVKDNEWCKPRKPTINELWKRHEQKKTNRRAPSRLY